MHFSSRDISPSLAYKILTSTVLPRPIAFITTISEDGHHNAAPFSFFNAMGSEPPVVVVGFQPNLDGTQKDTPRNILATQEFVVNIVDEALAPQMNICAASLPEDVDEIALAKLDTVASIDVRPARLKASPVSMECTLLNVTELAGGGQVIIGEVIHFHLKDDIIESRDPLRININALAPISRLNGAKYGRITDQFEIKRPK